MESLNHRRLAGELRRLIVFALALSVLVPGVFAQSNRVVSSQALAQIGALMKEKQSRSALHRKIDSQFLYEARMRRHERIAEGVDSLITDVKTDAQDRATVNIKASVNPRLLAQLKALGVEVVTSSQRDNLIHAKVPFNRIEAVASLNDVQYVGEEYGYMLQDVGPRPSAARTAFAARAAAVRSLLAAALEQQEITNVMVPPFTGQGSRESEGNFTHRASDARGTFHVDGTGIKIGVLSNGVVNLAAAQASGDLGPVTVLPGQTGSGDEGTAMLEIVHDIAPGAQLFFATANPTITQFAQNIRDLRTAGCDIIVDDVIYFIETPFQDGQTGTSPGNGGAVIQAVKDVTAAGALYFSSAGNEGNVAQNTAGVWEGDFKDGGDASGVVGEPGRLHDFGTGQPFDILNSVGSTNVLHWSDPLGASNNDYDLFRLNAAGTAVLAASTSVQSGTQDPFERVSAGAAGNRLVIVKFSGADRYLHLNSFRGTLSIFTSGQTHGHNSVRSIGAYGVAATPAAAPFGASTPGPFPNAFNTSNQTEVFTSDGPRRIFYNADGTPITAGNVSSTGGVVLSKPDITAADGVSVTGVGGFGSPFYGTSAAAPHAAAISALIKQALPGLTQAQFRTLIQNNAVDIGPTGPDITSGSGIIMPYQALLNGGAPGTADIERNTVVATENPGDGDGMVDPGEGGNLAIPLKNVGIVNATNVNATLTSSTPGVTVFMPNTQSYPNLAANGSASTRNFRFSTDLSVACNASIDFTLTVTYNGGPSPKVFNFKVPLGTLNITTTLDGTAPAASAAYIASTGAQNGRLSRSGGASVCGSLKAFQGVIGAGMNRQFDSYKFNTCSFNPTSCVSVSLAGDNELFSSTYAPSFTPGNLATNYLADPGLSGNTTYGFTVGAGAQTFVTNVAEVDPGLGIGKAYTLTVGGACFGACVQNHPPVAKAKNITVDSGADCLSSPNASVDDGSFDPDGDPITITQSPAGPYPPGTTNVILTVTDKYGAFSQATATVTVRKFTYTNVNAQTTQAFHRVTIKLTATLYTPCGSGPFSGTVTFKDVGNNIVLGVVPVSSNGTASLSLPTRTTPVKLQYQAIYSGDASNNGSESTVKTLTVTN